MTEDETAERADGGVEEPGGESTVPAAAEPGGERRESSSFLVTDSLLPSDDGIRDDSAD